MSSSDVAWAVAGGLGVVVLVLLAYLAGHAMGMRDGRRAVPSQLHGLPELWAYQRMLSDTARGVVDHPHDDLDAARQAAVPFAWRLPGNVRWVLDDDALPSDVGDRIDRSLVHLRMSEAIRTSLERRAADRIGSIGPTPTRKERTDA